MKGVLFGEDETYRSVLKLMESPDQCEIPSRSEGSIQYEQVVENLADAIKVDQRTITRLSQQLICVLTAYCEDTALAVVDSLEEHGPWQGSRRGDAFTVNRGVPFRREQTRFATVSYIQCEQPNSQTLCQQLWDGRKVIQN